MSRAPDNPWLHRFAVLTAAATLFLIWVGGLVTSRGVGMSVPDWPTTYGYNMFFFPVSKWVDGIFYEHSHRLVASGVGFLTVILAVWLWLKEEQPWVRWLGIMAVVVVILQGLLGGLRVTAMKDAIGIVHAALAQLFFSLVTAIALFTSRWWRKRDLQKLPIYDAGGFRYVFALVTGLILVQLIFGAAMRHQHAGLAIPDFPFAYGKMWPAMDEDSISRYNQARGEVTALNPITPFQIRLQMAHRLTALVIFGSITWLAGMARRRFGRRSPLAKLSLLWFALILAQVGLGAITIWTNKAADIATLHVAVGALTLVTGVTLLLITIRCASTRPQTACSDLAATASARLERSAAKATL